MIPATFDYRPVQSVEEAIALLQQHGDEAKILAGGQSLIPTMKFRLAQPGVLVDLGRIPGLSYIRKENGVVAIGAMTTYTALERSDLLRQHFAIILDALSVLADRQVRNRGTLGGSMAHADPAADLTAVVLALKGTFVAEGPGGTRTIAADDFFVETFATALQPDEIITEIRLPLSSAHTGSAYLKLENKASHYAIVGCAAVIMFGADGTCSSASIAITGAPTKPTRARAVEAALASKKLDETTLADAASHAAEGLELVGDIHGSQAYRGQMCTIMTRRAIMKAAGRAYA
jgi:aerobic carbon-monoxide dehydrogenase medium subunit